MLLILVILSATKQDYPGHVHWLTDKLLASDSSPHSDSKHQADEDL